MKPITGKASFSVLLGAALPLLYPLFFLLLHSLMYGLSLAYPKCAVKILQIKYCQA